MKMVFQQKVQEKESKLKQSEEELYARHREMKDALEKQRADLEEKKRRIESGRPLTPEKSSVSPACLVPPGRRINAPLAFADHEEEGIPPHLRSEMRSVILINLTITSDILRLTFCTPQLTSSD